MVFSTLCEFPYDRTRSLRVKLNDFLLVLGGEGRPPKIQSVNSLCQLLPNKFRPVRKQAGGPARAGPPVQFSTCVNTGHWPGARSGLGLMDSCRGIDNPGGGSHRRGVDVCCSSSGGSSSVFANALFLSSFPNRHWEGSERTDSLREFKQLCVTKTHQRRVARCVPESARTSGRCN